MRGGVEHPRGNVDGGKAAGHDGHTFKAGMTVYTAGEYSSCFFIFSILFLYIGGKLIEVK